MIQFSFFICCCICLLFFRAIGPLLFCLLSSIPAPLPSPQNPQTTRKNPSKTDRDKKKAYEKVWGEKSCLNLVFIIYECYCKLAQQVIFLFSMLTLGEGELPVPNLWLHQREAQLLASWEQDLASCHEALNLLQVIDHNHTDGFANTFFIFQWKLLHQQWYQLFVCFEKHFAFVSIPLSLQQSHSTALVVILNE